MDIFTRGFDSDEPQHLHVIWGWAHGYIQYRDVFDNHTPLFHLLFAPIFALLPEWDGALTIMRFAILPAYALALLATYLIGRHLYSHRTALWAMLFLALYKGFFLKTLEFRPDSLWTALLIMGVYLLVRRPLSKWSSLLAGFVFGAALAVSFKTLILMAALMLAIASTWLWAGKPFVPQVRSKAINLFWGTIGFLLLPLLIVILYSCLHALPELYYGVIQHNLLAHAHGAPVHGLMRYKGLMEFPLWLLATYGIGRYISRVTPDADRKTRRILVMCVGMLFLGILFSFWPLVTHQTELPAIPFMVLGLTPFLTGEYPVLAKLRERIRQNPMPSSASTLLLLTLASVQLSLLAGENAVFGRHANHYHELWEDVLKYTDSGDYVMDAKGETIFRKRPYFYGFETITMQLVASGKIADDSAEHLVAKPTYVVAAYDDYRYPGKLRSFISSNYLHCSTLFVAGKQITGLSSYNRAPIDFSIAIPGRYAITSSGKLVPGMLNGVSGNGEFDLQAGAQKFVPSKTIPSLTVMWAKAWGRGILCANS